MDDCQSLNTTNQHIQTLTDEQDFDTMAASIRKQDALNIVEDGSII